MVIARFLARTGLVLAIVAASACASAPAPVASPPSAPGPGLPVATGEQHLFRLTYDGGEGRASLRVVLRTTSTDRYQVGVSDVAGRKVWALDYSATRSVLVDHREKTFCVSGPDLRLSEVHPDELPLSALPRVLRGELPIETDSDALEAAGGAGYLDTAGRKWKATLEAGVLASWTLSDGEGPSVWWIRQGDGGILSRRGGEQYRWSRIVSEPTDEPLADIVPEGFREGFCGD